MQEIQDFYGRFGQVSLTVLALWVTALQIRYDAWVTDPDRHRVAGAVSLIFGLPGLMSFLSLIDRTEPLIWRISFVAGGLLGLAGVLTALVNRRPGDGVAPPVRAGLGLCGVLFGAIAVVALLSARLEDTDLALHPLQIEGILFTVLLTVGLGLAWMLLFAREVRPSR